MRPLILALAVLTAWPSLAWAQRPTGNQEVVTTTPELDGVRAQVPIPADFHLKNEGGSDGAGLCVITSNVSNGWYQDVPEFVDEKRSKVWRLAKGKPGGYYPAKLKDLFDEAGVKTAWVQAEGSAAELVPVIQHYLAMGIPVATTMSFSQRYQPGIPDGKIHHMIQTIHHDGSLACIVDNNFPGTYLWVTAAEYERRLVDGEAGWVVAILWGAKAVAWVVIGAAVMFVIGGVLLAAAAFVVALIG